MSYYHYFHRSVAPATRLWRSSTRSCWHRQALCAASGSGKVHRPASDGSHRRLFHGACVSQPFCGHQTEWRIEERAPFCHIQTSTAFTRRQRRLFSAGDSTQTTVLKPEIVLDGTNQSRHSSFSSSLILKQTDAELSPDELALKQALQQHNNLLETNSADLSATELQSSLETLRDAFLAVEYYDEALQVEHQLETCVSTNLDVAECQFRQGKLHMLRQDDRAAWQLYQQALERYQMEYSSQRRHHADIGNVLVAMAGVHFARGKSEECRSWLEQAEPHFRHHYDNENDSNDKKLPHPDLAKCLDNQGMLLRLQGDFAKALEKYQEALKVVEQHPSDSDNEKRQTLQLHVADMMGALGQFEDAIHLYQQIRHEDQQQRDDQEEETLLDAVIWHSIGVLHSQQRQLDLAEQELQLALQIKQRIGGEQTQGAAETMVALGAVYGVLGKKRQALECFQSALIIERQFCDNDDNDPQILEILRNISLLHGESVPKWED